MASRSCCECSPLASGRCLGKSERNPPACSNPESPPKVQTINFISVLQPTAELEATAAASLGRVKGGETEFSPLLLPIERTSWVACDGARRGTVLIEGASISVRLRIDLDGQPIATYTPDARTALPA